MKHLTIDEHIQDILFLKSGYLFPIFTIKGRGDLPPTFASCAPDNMEP